MIARSRAAVLVVAALALTGCPDKREPATDDRLLQRLQAEKNRLQQGGAAPTMPLRPQEPVEPEPNPLAQLAAARDPASIKKLPLRGTAPFVFQSGSLRVVGLEATHSVGEAISVTTEDWFLKVSLSAMGKDGLGFDLTGATLQKGAETYVLARDAQAASRRPAKVSTTTSAEAPVALFFEVPDAALGTGLTLVLPGTNGDTRIELQ